MKTLLIAASALTLGLSTVALAAGRTALRAGSARVEITPPVSALQPGAVIRDPLYVRAIVIDNGTNCAALVGVDQPGVRSNVVDAEPADPTLRRWRTQSWRH